jgi:CBS domain-containing protein
MSIEAQHATVLRGTVADLLAHKGTAVHAVGPQDSVYEAISRMTQHRVGALLVMDGARLLGIVSERDYTRRVILEGRASKDTPVQTIMTAPVMSVSPDSSLLDCLRMANQHSIRHLPVVNGATVVGVLSIGDLVRAVVEQQAEAIARMQSFIGSDYPN